MAFTVKSLTEVQSTIFDDLKKVYYCPNKIASTADLAKEHTLMQLPITEDGVTLNMGGVNTTFKKLNTGEIWGSTVDRDDPEVSFNVASVSVDVNEMFMGKGAIKNAVASPDGKSFDAHGYSLELKAVTGSLWFPAENGNGWVVLPDIKMYGGLNGTDDSNTAYFSCQVTPNVNETDKVSLYILSNSKATATPAAEYDVYVIYESKIAGVYHGSTAADIIAKAKADGYTITLSGALADGMTVTASKYEAPGA